jgi:cytochrome c peroxidase
MHARFAGGFAFLTAMTLAGLASEWVAVPQAQGGTATRPSTSRTLRPSGARTLRLPDIPYRYADIDLPAHFKTAAALKFDSTPPGNPLTDHGATLGRVLFYDTRLSANNTVSCGSCHAQAQAFDDPNQFSRGFKGGRTDRHAMNLVNLRYQPSGRFFWDERGGNLEGMVLLPAENTVEMGLDLAQLPAILARDRRYPELFRAAFGSPDITLHLVTRALAQFIRSMVSYQSRYDQGRAGVQSVADDFTNFTLLENRGKALFRRNCALCHLPNQDAHFVMTEPANTGLDDDARTTDGGVGDITLRPADLGRFKSPSLRNVEFSAPYMHDGRLATLEAVIDHYSSGGKNHPNRDIRIQPLHFTDSEKAALVAFLKTLTDRSFLTDPKFSDPFQ